MPPLSGTIPSKPAFAPTRLTIARQIVGVAKKEIADFAGVSAAAITRYETYEREPKPAVVELIAQRLGFPAVFFYLSELHSVAADDVTFRSRRSMTATLRERATAYSTLAVDIVSPAIRSRFKVPTVDVPDMSQHEPEKAAQMLRAYWQLGQGPIANMVRLLESRGVEVYWFDEESPSVSAFSIWSDKHPYVILNSHSRSGERSRFDAAHELAHLVLHREEADSDSRKVESEADRFAAAFLLPAEQFKLESPRYPSLSSYFPLKSRWGVSIAAMVRRSRDVGVITPWQYENACKEISVKRWRLQEPNQLGCENSLMHDSIFKMLAGKGISPAEFGHQIGIRPKELETLMPLASQYHDLCAPVFDPYCLKLLRVVDTSSKSGNMGLGTD